MKQWFREFAAREGRRFDRFAGAVALAVYWQPHSRGGEKFLNPFLRELDAPRAGRWAAAMWRLLSDLPEGDRHKFWQAWTSAHIAARLASHPMPLGPDESNQLLRWVVLHQQDFKKAVSLALRLPQLSEITGYIFLELSRSAHPSQNPIETCELLLFVLQKSKSLFGGQEYVGEIFAKFPANVRGLRALQLKVCDQLRRLGSPDVAAFEKKFGLR